MARLGRKLIAVQLEEIKSASQKARQFPLGTQEELLSEVSECKRRVTQMESECMALRIEIGEKDGVIKRMGEENVEFKFLNNAQQEQLQWTIIQNARLIEAHNHAIRFLNRSCTGTIKSYVWDSSTALKALQVKVAAEETKSYLLGEKLKTAEKALEEMKAKLEEEKVRRDKQEARADQEITQTKYRLWAAEKKLVKTSEKYSRAQNQLDTSFTSSVRSFLGNKLGLDRTDSQIFDRERLRIEKAEVDHEQQRLVRERKLQAKKIARGEEKCCVVCMDEEMEVDITFLPCGHNICCKKCSSKLTSCPNCRGHITKSIKTYH